MDGNYYIAIDADDGNNLTYSCGDPYYINSFYIDSTKPTIHSDINIGFQPNDVNVHLDANDNSGIDKIWYRLDTNSSNSVSYGDWTQYDRNILILQDGNWAIQYYAVDWVGWDSNTTATDFNTNYIIEDAFKLTATINKIDGYVSYPAAFNYAIDKNLSIDFNIIASNALAYDINFDINYSQSNCNTPSKNGVVVVKDMNAKSWCGNHNISNFFSPQNCVFDWNIQMDSDLNACIQIKAKSNSPSSNSAFAYSLSFDVNRIVVGSIDANYRYDSGLMYFYPDNLVDYNLSPKYQTDYNGWFQIANGGRHDSNLSFDLNANLWNSSNISSLYIDKDNNKAKAFDVNADSNAFILPGLTLKAGTTQKLWLWLDINLMDLNGDFSINYNWYEGTFNG